MRRFYRHPYKHNRGTLVSPGSGDHAGSQVAKSYIKICHPERSALERARVVEEPALSLPKGSLSSSRRSISRVNPARSSEFSPPQRTLAASGQGRAARDPSTPHGARFARRRALLRMTKLTYVAVGVQFFSFGRWQASTIFVGSIASLSTCSSIIFPSLPIRKFTRRAAWYWSL